MDWWQRWYRVVLGALLLATLAGAAVFFYRQTAGGGLLEIELSPPSPEIRVGVVGEVVRPGVYTLRTGDRALDAIQAAGGLTAHVDHEALELAAPLRDGDTVRVYGLGEVPQRVNINTAEPWLLKALPEIGEALAQRIVEYRETNGPFQRIEDLKKVRGIGEATFEKLKDRITVR